ncbi:hypothetical protein HELRODRAFT_163865 [Helobdella robusta]|uniref:Uncharacterized protein n=1 Tax=Helobdella robusta TaxID=6412 RepID=T1EUK0_HELRO|nr:hypothetical protein HELRODRAFT_163865 [Helobdella robusta]ESN96753.1 hypothetical protein HELRODRAFT_163865 [Helobdella robusta]
MDYLNKPLQLLLPVKTSSGFYYWSSLCQQACSAISFKEPASSSIQGRNSKSVQFATRKSTKPSTLLAAELAAAGAIYLTALLNLATTSYVTTAPIQNLQHSIIRSTAYTTGQLNFPQWNCNGITDNNEDKEFYLLQMKTDGQAGYCTSKIVKVHPSKAGKKRTIIAETDTVEVKLAILKLDDGKANSIYSGIAEVLDKFQLWSSIKVIISDTTSVNTGSKNGVVNQLQRI